MKQEQSIDDILRLLKQSYTEGDNREEVAEPLSAEEEFFAESTDEEIQAELIKTYGESSQAESVTAVCTEEDASDQIFEESHETVLDETDSEEGGVPEDEEEPLGEEDSLLGELRDFEGAEDLAREALPNVELDPVLDMDEAEAEAPVMEPMEEELRPAVWDILLQLGCDEDWESPEPEGGAKSPEDENAHVRQEEERRANWQLNWKKIVRAQWMEAIRITGLSLMTLFLCIYDAVPVATNTLRRSYPKAFVLIGMQLLLFAVLWIAPRMWRGFKHLLRLQKMDLYAMAALSVLFVLIYDTVSVAVSNPSVPPQFHGFSCLLMLLAELGSFWRIRRRAIYLAALHPDENQNHFTLTHDVEHDPVALTMHRGGLPYDKNVYSPRMVETQAFDSEIQSQTTPNHRLFSRMTLPLIIACLIFVMAAVWMGQKRETALVSGMVLFGFAAPIAAMFVPWIFTGVAIKRLRKRQIFFRDDEAVSSYSQADYLVFNDLHLFSKVTPSDVALHMYENAQAGDLLGCLDCLYKKIGGPLTDVFDRVPSEYAKKTVRVRRIKRNGIEAVVDRKHVLLVGDAAFMRQYGFSFEEVAPKKGKGTLCLSLDGRKTAKLKVQYRMEPLFETLVEYLRREKVSCVIETFDPLIQAKFVSSSRRLGTAPISVVHKGLSELKGRRFLSSEETECQPGLIVLSSRLKLAEAIIWSKRLQRMKRKCNGIGLFLSLLGFGFGVFALVLDRMADATQYGSILWVLSSILILILIAWKDLPRRNDLTVEDFIAKSRRREKPNQKKKKDHQSK